VCPAYADSPPASTDASDCRCNAGYARGEWGTCAPCAAGSYRGSQADASSCSPCPPNAFSAPASRQCACNSGYSQRRGGGAGGASNHSCVPCGPGHYKSAWGSEECEACARGKYLATSGGASGLACQFCPPGKYANTTAARVCTECSPGRFAAANGNDNEAACQLCDAGTYAGAAGSSACQDCPAGKYVETAGSKGEEACRSGSCAPNSMLPAGSRNASDCSCNAGYVLAERSAPAEAAAAKPHEPHCVPDAAARCSTCVPVRVVLLLPIARQAFTDHSQQSLQRAVAAAVQAPPAYVSIESIEAAAWVQRQRTGAGGARPGATARRQQAAAAIRVEVSIQVADSAAAGRLQDSFPLEKLNQELASLGLPPAVLESRPAATLDMQAGGGAGTGAQNATGESFLEALGFWQGVPVTVLLAAAGGVLLLLLLVAAYLVYRSRCKRCRPRRCRQRGGQECWWCCGCCLAPCKCWQARYHDGARNAPPSAARLAPPDKLPPPVPSGSDEACGGSGASAEHDPISCFICQARAL